ncbi:hypothetical protein [Herbaspirillum sp. alder98]|uniref:hypothetical protein n=1 Tax=Herbaspirillum sp. alder98 TaxID=2913096 RepID=UPI001CD81B4C|nr:hypothetical protein [Herbaspirillum sp. alder98]MCA1326106.1 hypothetical protein [Herbaspirillum sp. alder98]
MIKHKPGWPYRLEVTWRLLAASVGGYQVTSAACALMALAIAAVTPLTQAEAVLLATLLGFLFYALFAIWMFSSRSMLRVWSSLLLALLISAWQLLY